MVNRSHLHVVCKSLHDVINDTIWCDGKKITRIWNWKRKTQTRKQNKKDSSCKQVYSVIVNSVGPLKKKTGCWGWKQRKTHDLYILVWLAIVYKTGWMFGKLDGRVGIFPADYVEPMSRIEARKISASSSRHTNQQVNIKLFFLICLFSFFFPHSQMSQMWISSIFRPSHQKMNNSSSYSRWWWWTSMKWLVRVSVCIEEGKTCHHKRKKKCIIC